jgi:glucose-1-phosphate adenylyltransferase
VTIREGAVVEDCVLMDGVDVRSGAVVRRAIVDKNVVVPPGVQLGVDPERDGRRFQLSERGIVAIGKGQAIRPDE